jgi:hypothetical protein
MVHYDFIAESYAFNLIPKGIHDPRDIAPANMKIVGLSHPLTDSNHVYGETFRSPDIVEVDPRGHHGDEDIVGHYGRDFDFLHLKSCAWISEAILTYDLSEHILGHFTKRRK